MPGGRCEACEGNGQKWIEMHFLPDVWVECDTCRGQRYNPETLAVQYHGKSIADVLDMPCGEALELFGNIPKIRRILQTLCDVGLDYLTLGQPAPTLSGGEAQRVKLAAELARPDTGRTLYLLDEPTTGLHFDDLAQAARRAQPPGRSGQHGRRHRAQPRRDQDGRLGHRPGPGSRRRRRPASSPRARRSRSPGPRGAYTGRDPERDPRRRAATKSARSSTRRPPPQGPGRGALARTEELRAGAKMPWEVDGRRWHTRDRVSRGGSPARWDGRILERLDDRIHELGDFAPTDWSRARSCGSPARDPIAPPSSRPSPATSGRHPAVPRPPQHLPAAALEAQLR